MVGLLFLFFSVGLGLICLKSYTYQAKALVEFCCLSASSVHFVFFFLSKRNRFHETINRLHHTDRASVPFHQPVHQSSVAKENKCHPSYLIILYYTCAVHKAKQTDFPATSLVPRDNHACRMAENCFSCLLHRYSATSRPWPDRDGREDQKRFFFKRHGALVVVVVRCFSGC